MALPGYLEDTAKDYAAQATKAYSVPVDTSKFTGSQFIAGEDPLQTSAIAEAQAGVGSYKPYLTAATANLGAAGTAQAGLGALTGAQAYQPFMSPYQQDVIDTSLQAFDTQAQQQQQALRDQALGVPGAFGGGREGVQQAQYQSQSDLNRAALQAQLMQQNFGQAQTAAQQAFQNQQAIGQGQLGLGAAQMGLSNFQRTGMGGDIGALGQLGAMRQGITQAGLSADQQAAQTAAYEPYGRLSQYGQGITGLAGGVAGMQYQEPQQANPWASALGSAMGVGGLFGKIYGK
jgi:Arc/MetJ-type ribon-helix-helix transcriptional regulator